MRSTRQRCMRVRLPDPQRAKRSNLNQRVKPSWSCGSYNTGPLKRGCHSRSGNQAACKRFNLSLDTWQRQERVWIVKKGLCKTRRDPWAAVASASTSCHPFVTGWLPRQLAVICGNAPANPRNTPYRGMRPTRLATGHEQKRLRTIRNCFHLREAGIEYLSHFRYSASRP